MPRVHIKAQERRDCSTCLATVHAASLAELAAVQTDGRTDGRVTTDCNTSLESAPEHCSLVQV